MWTLGIAFQEQVLETSRDHNPVILIRVTNMKRFKEFNILLQLSQAGRSVVDWRLRCSPSLGRIPRRMANRLLFCLSVIACVYLAFPVVAASADSEGASFPEVGAVALEAEQVSPEYQLLAPSFGFAGFTQGSRGDSVNLAAYAGQTVFGETSSSTRSVQIGIVPLFPEFSRPEPSLRFARIDSMITLEWPADLDAVLEASNSLVPSTWAPVQQGISDDAETKSIAISAEENYRFFRLRINP